MSDVLVVFKLKVKDRCVRRHVRLLLTLALLLLLGPLPM